MTMYPNNTLAQYVTNLPRRVSLSGEWECGLTDIHYPHDWYNFRNARLTISHGNSLDTDRYIDDGYYDSPNALVSALNGEKGGRVKFSYDRVTQKVCEQMKGDTTFKLYGYLIDILGFRERHDQNGDLLDTPGEGRSMRSSKNVASMSFPAETVVDLRRGFESLYVYSGIVEPRIVGDKIAPLLRVVPITGRHGAMVTSSFDHVQYIPVLSREFGTIETEIRDDTGRLVPFGCGKVTVTMHFRRRRHSSGLFFFVLTLRGDESMINDDAMNYNEYYAQQVGGALPYFTGSRVQRGHGFGSLLGGLLRTVAPLIKMWRAGAGKSCIKDWHTNSW